MAIKTFNHKFRLRKGFSVSLRLPVDLTPNEADRLGLFFKSVVVAEDLSGHAQETNFIARPSDAEPDDAQESNQEVSQKTLRGALGKASRRPRGRKYSLPVGIRRVRKMRGGATSGQKVGSGEGNVDVGLRVRTTRPGELLKLPAGLQLVPSGNDYQNGLLVQDVEVPFGKPATYDLCLMAYCANRNRKPADESCTYSFGRVIEEPKFQELFGLLKNKSIDGNSDLIQRAVWEITDGTGLEKATRAEIALLESQMFDDVASEE